MLLHYRRESGMIMICTPRGERRGRTSIHASRRLHGREGVGVRSGWRAVRWWWWWVGVSVVQVVLLKLVSRATMCGKQFPLTHSKGRRFTALWHFTDLHW